MRTIRKSVTKTVVVPSLTVLATLVASTPPNVYANSRLPKTDREFCQALNDLGENIVIKMEVDNNSDTITEAQYNRYKQAIESGQTVTVRGVECSTVEELDKALEGVERVSSMNTVLSNGWNARYKGKTIKGSYTGREYSTTGSTESNSKLREMFEDYMGIGSLYTNRNNTVYADDYKNSDVIRRAMLTVSMRKQLGEIGEQTLDCVTSDIVAAPDAVVGTYYNILNTEDGLLNFENGGEVTREQFACMLYRTWNLESTLDSYYNYFDGAETTGSAEYKPYSNAYAKQMMLSPSTLVEYSASDSEMANYISRVECAWLMTNVMKDEIKDMGIDVDECIENYKEAFDLFFDVTEDCLISDEDAEKLERAKSKGEDAYHSLMLRYCMNNKVMTKEMLGYLVAANKAGLIKVDQEGNLRPWEHATMSETIRFCTNSCELGYMASR